MIDKNYNYFSSITAEKVFTAVMYIYIYIIKTLLKGVKNHKKSTKMAPQ